VSRSLPGKLKNAIIILFSVDKIEVYPCLQVLLPLLLIWPHGAFFQKELHFSLWLKLCIVFLAKKTVTR